MSDMTLQQLSDRIGKLDFGMLSTRTTGGSIASRPMSNNGDVDYDGDSYFFSHDSARTISDIENDAHVGLNFSGDRGPHGEPPLFIAIAGQAELIRDKATFKAHWIKDLEHWFEQGVDTPGLIMIKVVAERIHYWGEEGDGELVL